MSDRVSISGDLSPEELTSFARCEGVIERGLATFVDVGAALLEIRDGRLYRSEFGAFEDYCRERWGFGRRRANELISSAEAVGAIAPTGLPVPENEGQARELARVPEGERAEVWRETIERTDGKPTAAATRTTTRMRQTAALLLERAYNRDYVGERLGDVTPARPDETTPELLDAAVAYLNARGITYPGVAEAAERIRAELPAPTLREVEADPEASPVAGLFRGTGGLPTQRREPSPGVESGIWHSGPAEPEPPVLPDGQDRADAEVHRIERAAASAPEPKPDGPSRAVVDYIAADPAWQDKAYVTSFAKALKRSYDLMQFDPERLGRIAPEDVTDTLEGYLASVERFVSKFHTARKGLRVIKGGQ